METRTVQLFMVVLCLCRTESSPFPKGQRAFTLEEVVPLKDFYPEIITVQWMSDTEFIRREPGAGLVKYNTVMPSVTTLLDEMDLYLNQEKMLYTFSQDGNYLLLIANKKKVYRYSFIANYFLMNLKDKSIQKIANGLPLQVVVWSGSNALAYVKDNNVFYIPDLKQADASIQLTTKGVPGEVYFGVTDWIYEEEVFNAAEALWFSSKGTYLAVASFNDTSVESAVYPYYGNISDQYPEMVEFKYPKAGRTNPRVGLHVYKLDHLHSEPWNIPAPVDVVGLDHILGRVTWASDQNLVVLWLNRRQSISILVNCDLKQDKCSMIKEQREPNGWIDINKPFFDKTGTKMIEIQPLYHGDQRFLHAARLDFLSLTTEDLSPGNSTVTEILGWDEDRDIVYYIVSPCNLPWQRQLWASSEGIVRCVTCKESSCHYVTAIISPKASYGLVTCTAANSVPIVYYYNFKNGKADIIKNNANLAEKLSHYKIPLTLFNVITLEDDVMAHVKLSLPADIQQDKKYPMVLRVYAGPGTARVKDSFDLEFYGLYLSSNRSFIVAAIDVRGSGVMGVEAMHAVNRALGTVEVTDTLAAVRKLLSLYSFIDPKRVGVWGWSYGGYTSTMMLIKDDKKMLACAAAVAPVTSWLYYDSIYTERYMDTPQENPVGYNRSDVITAAEKLRGRKFLLIHGTGDDNVHYQHSMQLSKELQHADIPFEQMSYTDENHSLMGVSRHFYHMLDHFWTQCFDS
ncbi:unnamed protein product [Diatraea saccharalis]|uniref:Venom dipeptidyl peptidase 4 n=1 Tax=Diatraea saccharalis TaxID=40085 RepID=A0A9P0C5L9_9NEOP|nr:unnamed protein product [Diatraea saccharalis]